MVFSDRFFNSEEEKESISQYLEKLYSDLLTQFTRADEKEFDIQINYLDFSRPIKKSIHIIYSNYNIPIKTLEEDYRWLETYLEATKFPEIESHLVRVSLEFGSWIVFFRSKTNEFLKPRIQKVLQIWRGLFVDVSSDADDLLYLLIELENLSRNIGEPLLELWNSQFEYRPSSDPTTLIMALALNVTVRLGEDVLKGAIRTLEKRLEEMTLEEILEERNPLIEEAEEFRMFLLEEIQTIKGILDPKFSGPINKKFFATLLLVGLIERFVKTEKQQEPIFRDDAILDFIKFLKTEDLKSSIDKALEVFEQTMFESNISDPLLLLKLIIEKILDGSDHRRIEAVHSEIRDLIEKKKMEIITAGEQNPEMAIILAVQETFPKILEKIAQAETTSDMERMVEKNEKATQLILIFIDRLSKLRRIGPEGQDPDQIKSAITSLYNNAIINGIPLDLFTNNLQVTLSKEYGIHFEKFEQESVDGIIEEIYEKVMNWLNPKTQGNVKIETDEGENQISEKDAEDKSDQLENERKDTPKAVESGLGVKHVSVPEDEN